MLIKTALVFTHQRGSGNLVYLADTSGRMSTVYKAERVGDVNTETETVERKGMNKEVRLPGVLEHQATGIFLNALLFATLFLLFYFVFIAVFKEELTGLVRLGCCWLGAYALTWVCSYLAQGKARLLLTIFFIAILCAVIVFLPY